MPSQVEERLKLNNLTLPSPAAPAANYVPFRIHQDTIYISGQLPYVNGELKYIGKIGQDFDIEDGQEAARLCALNILAQLKKACDGDLSRIEACLRLGGYVNCTPDFTQQPKVINGASDIMIQVFGDHGLHARAAVGVNALPLGVAVEIDAIFALKQ
jgi:enamine deaminase RidA (YjgF/YER057c/UK114 family)